MIAFSNTTPFIALASIDRLELLPQLFAPVRKTHYVLHALLDKGLVKIENFKRNDNKLAYAYLLTPKGLRAKLSLTRSFLARKEAEFELLRTTIARLRQEAHPASASDPVKSPSSPASPP